MRRVLALTLMPLLLNGCAGMLLTTGTQAGMAVAENRSIGRKVDDTVIYTDLTNQFLQADKANLLGKVTFNVRYARVMLTGAVATDEEAQEAVALSWKAKGVTEVINELIINPDAGFFGTAEDSIIKRNLEGRLLITKGVWVINYSIDVQAGTAYLIGRVKDQAELERALSVVRTTRGVKRVISHLQINPDTSHTVQSPDGSSPYNTSSQPAYSNSSGQYNDAPTTTHSNTGTVSSVPASGGSDIYTGPVYSSGSISSSPN